MNITASAPVRKAMILAAGLGTRFKPWTDHHPKALATVNGKSLLQRNIEYLQHHGISDLVINVHHFADQIIGALKDNKGWGSRYVISDETSQVLETGGGLKKARPLLEDGAFVLLNVDILTDMPLSAMIEDHLQHRPLVTLAVTGRSTSRYFLFNDKDELCGWRNVQTGQERPARPANGPLIQKAFSGIHVIDPAIFPLITREGKFSTVDMYLDLAAAHIIRGFDHSDSKFIDVGKPEAVEAAERLFPL
ncbi:MAG TPA: nucleotidyltransferase family protein [Puia sp.]|uniref:nucleotidyltransferase family protein n=1 Tax=Puia sp. TaxID=2045100 RepID=UPI002CF7FF43|nr:nucleotidyltransferase family protein [Puia sp.]HVU98902.1 nucleotidyltransferase family protein [Puia sp.]